MPVEDACANIVRFPRSGALDHVDGPVQTYMSFTHQPSE
jgi:hypothetical protein